MKTIEVDEELYRYIARQTQHIGESASEILRRLLGLPPFTGDAQESPFPAEAVTAAPVEPERLLELQALLDSNELASRESAIDRFMLILSALYQKNPQEAFDLTMAIHNEGKTVVTTVPHDIATTKCSETIASARANGFPLYC